MHWRAFMALSIVTIFTTPFSVAASSPTVSYPTLRLTLNGHAWQLRLTRVFSTHYIGTHISNPVTAKGKYIVLSFDALNLTKQPNDLYSDQDFLLLDSTGRTFSIDANATGAAQAQYAPNDTSQVQPSLTNHVYFAFDIAKDASHLRLLNHPYEHLARLLYILKL